MGRILPPVCRYCRREGIKLFLKGSRCDTKKCAIEREGRNSPPGMHAWRRGKTSEYGVRLREKQKVKRFYGVLDRQFMKYFKEAARTKGNTGEFLITLLERRLDNVVFRAGLSLSRRHGRQLVGHGHVYVNGRKTDIPSFLVKRGDVISVKPVDKSKKLIRESLEINKGRTRPSWLEVDEGASECKIVGQPGVTPSEVGIPFEAQLIVELCSK
jgi:small subunit ribosomal protein S4